MARYYEILDVAPASDFAAIKKAYYRRAMACHPDRFAGNPAKAEEFKQLVEAFNVLSDPLARALYDARTGIGLAFSDGTLSADTLRSEASILDSPADDILEEMIVGNTIPRGTTLQTLMLDLERTERFCMFREGKTLFYSGRMDAAQAIFEHYLVLAPLNILAHYYRGRCLAQQGRYRAAAAAFSESIRIGSRRRPPLQCRRIRRELDALNRTRRGWPARLVAWWKGAPPGEEALPPAEAARREVNRALHNLLREEQRRARALPKP